MTDNSPRKIKSKNILEAIFGILSFECPIKAMLVWCLAVTIFIDQTKLYESIIMLQFFIATWIILTIMIIYKEYDVKKRRAGLLKDHLLSDDRLISAIIFAAFILRLIYVVRMGCESYQNDGGKFITGEGGHLGYIYYIYEHWHIADFDPTSRWQFYHPPFHYFVAAVWAKFNHLLGYSDARIAENIQILSLMYSSLIIVVTDRIMKLFDSSRLSRVLVVSIISIYPYFVMTSGAINNDCLVTLLTLSAIYYTIVWYRDSSMKNIVILGILIGLSMMTKMSGALIAPAVAVVFLIKFIKDRRRFIQYFKEFGVFGVISALLGLWYPIRNLIRYDMPINYVMKLGDDMAQYIGECNILSRFFDFGASQFAKYYIVWDNKNPEHSHNIFISLIKFGAFNEWRANLDTFSLGANIAYALIIVMIILTLMIIVIRTYGLIKDKNIERDIRIFLYLVSFIISVSYFKFCIEYAQICTMNVRYVLIPIIINTVGFGMGIDSIGKSDVRYKRWIVNGVVIVCVIFAILSMVTLKATIGYAC